MKWSYWGLLFPVKPGCLPACILPEPDRGIFSWCWEVRCVWSSSFSFSVRLTAQTSETILRTMRVISHNYELLNCSQVTCYQGFQRRTRITLIASPLTEKTRVNPQWNVWSFPDKIALLGQPCVFPFLVDERLYYTCTRAGDLYEEEWCATITDLDHSVKEWGHCSQGCQDLKDKGQT